MLKIKEEVDLDQRNCEEINNNLRTIAQQQK